MEVSGTFGIFLHPSGGWAWSTLSTMYLGILGQWHPEVRLLDSVGPVAVQKMSRNFDPLNHVLGHTGPMASRSKAPGLRWARSRAKNVPEFRPSQPCTWAYWANGIQK